MKYNIFTVLNEGYAPFGIMFVYSILDRLDLRQVGNIYVYDTGLSEDTKKRMSISDKVKIIDSGMTTKSDGRVHDEAWQQNVYSKARLLKHCIQTQDSFLPTVMVDADCIFVEEFFNLIDTNSVATLCERSMRGRVQGHQATSTHIGSFFSVNKDDEEAIKFLDHWIAAIDRMPEKDPVSGAYTPKESPALSETYKHFKEEMKLTDLPEPVVANIELHAPPDARIHHLKSDFRYLTVDARITQPRAVYYAQRYLT